MKEGIAMNWTIETANTMVKIFEKSLNEPISEDTRQLLLLEKTKWEHRRDVKRHYVEQLEKSSSITHFG